MDGPRRAPAEALPAPLLSVADLRTGFGGASLMVLAYPLIRLSGGSKIFNLPMLCALFAILASGFVFFLIPRSGAPRSPIAGTRAEN
jgi:hypothetical protein